jgi:hypothetical protein
MDDFLRVVLTDIIRRGESGELEGNEFTYVRDGRPETIDQATLRQYVREIKAQTEHERN